MTERTYSRAYAASLPMSRMVYPDHWTNQIKYYIFKIYTPMHPFFRDLLLSLRLIHHEGRQDYLLGVLREDKSIDDFLAHLVKSGFGNHFIAWVDDGEIASLRLVKNFDYQYHLRVFKDGEIRGHYEYTPECRPIAHLNEIDITHRREDFMAVLDGWINESVS